jgi:cobalt-zinc-cadmium efflux system outer membrane protein
MHLPFIALLLLPVVALAQPLQPLSLSEAEALWQLHSRELQLARSAQAGAEADVQVADQIPNPQLSLNFGSLSPAEGFGSGPLRDKKMDSIFRVEQLIERGSKRELRVRSAEARLDASRSEVHDIGRLQRLTLHQAYYDLRLGQEKRRISGETAAFYDKGVEIGRLRLKAGDIAPVDLARLQVDKSRADNDARQAQAELEQAQVLLAYLVGRENEAGQLVAGDDWPAIEKIELQRGDPEQRPDVIAARQRVLAAEAARDLARAQKTRDVTVGAQYEHNLQNAPQDSFGVGVSIPLFLWHEYEGDIARAEADLSSARIVYEQTLAQAIGNVDQAGSALRSAEDRRRRLEGGLLADAERVAKAAELAYQRGAMNLMDLLDARRTLRQVQLEAAAARADYAKALAAWRLQADYGRSKQ